LGTGDDGRPIFDLLDAEDRMLLQLSIESTGRPYVGLYNEHRACVAAVWTDTESGRGQFHWWDTRCPEIKQANAPPPPSSPTRRSEMIRGGALIAGQPAGDLRLVLRPSVKKKTRRRAKIVAGGANA